MTDSPAEPVTSIAVHRADGVEVRGRSLAADLIGRVTFTDLIMLGTLGRLPDPDQRRLLDGCLVALAEAGLNPSTLVTRMVATAAPDQTQAAMAAGLLTVADRYVGSVQDCAELLTWIAAGQSERVATAAVADLRAHGRRIPGLGHGRHRTDDPRAAALTRLAGECGGPGPHLTALRTLRAAAERELGRPLVINVTGAVAGVLLDLGFPATAARPLAVAARAGGLAGHVVEELRQPTSATLWADAQERIRYCGPDDEGHGALNEEGLP